MPDSALELPPSQWVDLGARVHWVDYRGPAGAARPPLVCVHGLGGSQANWAGLAPKLAEHRRVVALDLAGFGRTRAGARTATVGANRRLLHRFLTEVIGAPAVLVGNSMGGMISAIQAARQPGTVTGLALLDPALPPPALARPDPLVVAAFATYAMPFAGREILARRLRTLSPQHIVEDMLALCCADPSRVSQPLVDLHVAMATERRGRPDAEVALIAAARSLMAVLARRRNYARLLAAVQAPVLLLHGSRDRLVHLGSATAAARANPRWRFRVAHGVGHIPMLEAPDWTAAQILDWLGEPTAGRPSHGQAAATG